MSFNFKLLFQVLYKSLCAPRGTLTRGHPGTNHINSFFIFIIGAVWTHKRVLFRGAVLPKIRNVIHSHYPVTV